MKTRIAVGLLVAAILGYLLISAERAVWFFSAGLIGQVIAISILAVSGVGLYLIYREIQFGFAVQRVLKAAASIGLQLEVDLPVAPSGKFDRAAADAEFYRLMSELNSTPESWQDWLRVSIAYDNARDTKRARSAMRNAIKVFAAQD